MDVETGKILNEKQFKLVSDLCQNRCVPIDGKLLTAKQVSSNQVSLYDNRSPLGKFRILTRNKARNKPCPCGSGKKYKKCCWNKQ
jgi:preprotein translocase subunit SecA